jgi:ATP-dependent exoDNAse (exonuclease V) beta subunit
MALTVVAEDGVRNVRIDRTFVEGGIRWIIDFKSTQIEGGSPERFFDLQVEKYAPDLERYREAVRLLDSRPVKCALYFPLQREWHVVIE